VDQCSLIFSGMEPTPRTTVRRIPARARYDEETIHSILDEALIVHLGFAIEQQPFVIPTIHARVGNCLYVHGAVASRMLKALTGGATACVSATIVDGLVMARSAFHHSMNYRSAIVFGTATLVERRDEKLAALEAIVEHVARGRSREARPPNDKELAATTVLAIPIHEASAKVRTGGPIDDDDDASWPCWAGVIPLSLAVGYPVEDPRIAPLHAPSDVIKRWALGSRDGREAARGTTPRLGEAPHREG
jgi:nitroimidazol reductase NimA-like FMN-containing flavoprotein (pyridoxamine 5'-phosphate oxidase superfamily)